MFILANIISGAMRPSKFRKFEVAVYNNSGHYIYKTFIAYPTIRANQVTEGSLKVADCKICDSEVHDHYELFVNELRVDVDDCIDFMEDCLIVKFWVDNICDEPHRQFWLRKKLAAFTASIVDPDYPEIDATIEEYRDVLKFYLKEKQHPSRMYLEAEEIVTKVSRLILNTLNCILISLCCWQ